jgi:hypothetical protein
MIARRLLLARAAEMAGIAQIDLALNFKNYYAENRYKSIENARLRRDGIYLAFT